MKSDLTASVRFLRQWSPDGPWVISAIDPRAKKVVTQTWKPEDHERMVKWIETFEDWNFYFSVNPVIRAVSKKTKREDIKALAWLHVDIDPRVGEDPEEEKKRAIEMFTGTYQGVPPASVILDSGNGIQAFWCLETPYEINGSVDRYEEAKLWNVHLERVFGADHCHNVDRIMRLPGTVNVPTEKKIKKGLTEKRLARLIRFGDEVYPLSAFTKATMIQEVVNGKSGALAPPEAKTTVTGNIPRLDSIDDVNDYAESPVPDWCRALCVQGNHPDPDKSFDSRSEALFAACCELVRCGVPDEIIYSIITDKDFYISESVLDKGRSVQRYALRQIDRAKEHAIDPLLQEMNAKFAVIGNHGGKCVVIEETYDQTIGRHHLSKQTFQNFRDRFMNRYVDVGLDKKGNPVRHPLGKWWLEHTSRRQYDRIVFSPECEIPGAYNLWQGFAVAPIAGDCSRYLAHVRDNICNGDEDCFKYLIGWMATCVQFPARPGHVAVVLRGERGTGKGRFVKQFGSLWGRHFMQVSNSRHLVGDFNAHLRDCIVLFGDESFYAGDKKHESILKTLITEEQLTIEAKYADAHASPNYVHLIMASNSSWVVPAGEHERRYFVIDVGNESRQNTSYFEALIEEENTGGREALLHYLMHYDLSGFDLHKPPKTEALAEQKDHSLDAVESWWRDCLHEGSITEGSWPLVIQTRELRDTFNEYCRFSSRYRDISMVSFGKRLSRLLPGGERRVRRVMDVQSFAPNGEPRMEKKRVPCYEIPPLDDCRRHWEAYVGQEIRWPVYTDRDDEDPPEQLELH